MNILDAFPSKYLRAADLKGRDKIVTINDIKFEEFPASQGKPKETKAAVFFQECDQGVLLNKVNRNTIIDLYGPETDDWMGKRIALFPTQVDYQGKQVEAIRVRIRPPAVPTGNAIEPTTLSGTSSKGKAFTAFNNTQTGESRENIAAAWKRAVQNYFGPSRSPEVITPAEWDMFRTDDFVLPPTDAQLSGESQISDDDIPF